MTFMLNIMGIGIHMEAHRSYCKKITAEELFFLEFMKIFLYVLCNTTFTLRWI